MGEDKVVGRKPGWDPIKEVAYVLACVAIAMSVHAFIWGTTITVNMYTHFKLPPGAKKVMVELNRDHFVIQFNLGRIKIDRANKTLLIDPYREPSGSGEGAEGGTREIDLSEMSDSDFDAMAHYIDVMQKGFRYRMSSVKYSLLAAIGSYILIWIIRFAIRSRGERSKA